jgi:hypothetical protein
MEMAHSTSSPLGIEPGHSPQEKTNGRGLLLIRQHLDVGKASGIVDGHMGFLIACATTRSQTPITSDPVPEALKTGLLLGVDMDHVAGPTGSGERAQQAADS